MAMAASTGSGEGLSTGSAAMSIVAIYQITATGTGTTTGSAALRVIAAVTATGLDTSTGSAAMSIQAQYALSASGLDYSTGSVQILLIEAVRFFSPPTHEEPIRSNVRPLNYYRLTWAPSVVRVNGVFATVRSPHVDLLTAAGVEGVDYFIGGHLYEVSAQTASELVAAGYTLG